MTISLSRLLQRTFAAAALAGSLAGCANLDVSKAVPWSEKKEAEEVYEEPQRIVSIWNENTLHHSNGPSSRGFGGRLIFYGKDKETPIKVKGDLIVYAYDETEAVLRGEPAAATSKPTCRFKFKADKFQEHLRESTAGHAYDFWVPWDKVGGEKKIVTLAPVLVLANGRTIPGEPKQCVLVGRTPQIDHVDVQRIEGSAIERFGVQPASYEKAATAQTNGAAPSDRRSVETTTISIPTGLAKRLGSQPQLTVHPPYATPQRSAQENDTNAASRGPRDTPIHDLSYPQPGYAAPATGEQSNGAVNSPATFHPPLRARSALGQPPVPRAPTARPASSQPSWEQYRSGQRPSLQAGHPRPVQPNGAATWSGGSSTTW